jgi:hypothetical protein
LVSDFDLGQNSILDEAVVKHLKNFSLEELSYIVIADNVLN